MNSLARRSDIEKCADKIRNQIQTNRWDSKLPNVVKLADELKVSQLIIRSAVEILDNEGIVKLANDGYSRDIVALPQPIQKKFRIVILMSEPAKDQVANFQQLLLALQHQLEDEGFVPVLNDEMLAYAEKDVSRMASVVEWLPADAYIIISAKREISEWFASYSKPCLGIFGHGGGLPIARVGSNKSVAMSEALEYLIGLGHKRIVLLNRGQRRIPRFGKMERTFIGGLEAQGIETSDYNMPDWEETSEGFYQMLEKMFKNDPPTAILTDEMIMWTAAQQFLAQKKILVPQEVSMISLDDDPLFRWCIPAVSRFKWEGAPIVAHTLRWAESVQKGEVDIEQTFFPAKFVIGGTIAPPPLESVVDIRTTA